MAIKRPFKMLIYAPPGTGKSVFASRLPKPFFICTDGNYEWLLDFGANENDHVDISSFAEFEKLASNDFAGYDTIVVDLIEDIYKWNEYEYCKKLKVDHLSDAGGYGKGWDITRNRLFVACSKLLSHPKNVVFLSHESSYTEKDRKGNEKTKYCPSNLMSEKFLTMLEGRLRYVLRAKFQDEVLEDGRIVTHRVLSLVPKSDEYGIIRGVDTNIMPEDIELDAETFLQVIGYVGNDEKEEKAVIKATPVAPAPAPAPVPAAELVEPVATPVAQPAASTSSTKESIKEKLARLKAKQTVAKAETAKPVESATKPVESTKAEEPAPVKVEPVPVPEPVEEVVEETVEEVVEEPVEEPVAEPVEPAQKTVVIEETVEPDVAPVEKKIDNADKIAKIKAKLAAKQKK